MKKVLCLLVSVILVITLTGCGNNEKEKQDVTTKSADQTVALNAGEAQVYPDEARYYAYTAQSTYEIYFISEGKEIDWTKQMKDGITWEQGVKSTVLDDICRRECMYALQKEYNIDLTDDEKKEIEIDVNNFFEKTSDELISKIDIKKERLKFIFEKARIADRVEEIMMASDKNLPDETYEKWKKGNTVTAEEQWKSITFSRHIFTAEDLDKASETY